MSITIPTKDIGDVKDKMLPYAKVCQRAMHEQDYIKNQLGVQDAQK